jgi:hypothetical protein
MAPHPQCSSIGISQQFSDERHSKSLFFLSAAVSSQIAHSCPAPDILGSLHLLNAGIETFLRFQRGIGDLGVKIPI